MSLYRKTRDVKRSGKDAKWYVGIRRHGQLVQVCTGTSDRDKARMIESQVLEGLVGFSAERVAENVKRLLGGGSAVASLKLAELHGLVTDLIRHEGLVPKSVTRRLNIVAKMVEWMKKHGCVRISDVSVQKAWEFIGSLDGKAKTKQNIAGELSATWTMLRRAGYARDNPWTDARPKSQPDETKTGTAFSHEEILRILEESKCFVQTNPSGSVDENARCEPRVTWLTIAIMLAVYTGLRQNDVFKLEWSSIDRENGMFVVMPSKTKRYKRIVRIPIHRALLSFLNDLERVGDRIVPNAPLRPNKAWNLCVKRAGVVRSDSELTTFHSLRHTYATLVRDAGADKGEQMLLGGWTNVATANRYDHASDRLRSIVDKMPTISLTS